MGSGPYPAGGGLASSSLARMAGQSPTATRKPRPLSPKFGAGTPGLRSLPSLSGVTQVNLGFSQL